jgi:hypothetical protein
MATQARLRDVVFDVLRTIKETHPDSSVTVAQVAYWAIVHADRLRKAHIGQASSGAYLQTFRDIDALVNPADGRNYIILPAAIYDYDDDKGIDYITYKAQLDPNRPTFTSVQFTRTTIPESRRLYMSEDEVPTPANPYFYREGDRLYFLGCEQIDLLKVEAGIFTTLLPVDATRDLDEVLEIPPELLPQLKAEVVALGLFIIKLPEEYKVDMKENAINIVTAKDIQS